MTLINQTGCVRSKGALIPALLTMIGFGLLGVGAVATAAGLLVLVERSFTSAAGTLAVDALKPFFD